MPACFACVGPGILELVMVGLTYVGHSACIELLTDLVTI